MGYLPSLDSKGFIVKRSNVPKFKMKKRKKNRRNRSKKLPPQALKASQYRSYIGSKKWAKRRRRYYAQNPNCCKICGSREGLELHHLTYKNLGNEPDADLVPLCDMHHEAFHKTIGGSKLDMRKETELFIEASKYDDEAARTLRQMCG